MKYDVASITDIGKVRSNNQDRVLALTGYVGSTRTVLLAVADEWAALPAEKKASGIAVKRPWKHGGISAREAKFHGGDVGGAGCRDF